MRGLRIIASALAILWAASVGLAQTQPSAVLLIDLDALYQNSRYAVQLQGNINEERLALQAENRRLFDSLRAEELRITQLRQSLSPEEFADIADAFEERVTGIRRAQDEKARQSDAQLAALRQAFFRRAAPVIDEIREELGAAVVLPRGDGIISFARTADITQRAIDRIDKAYAGPAQ